MMGEPKRINQFVDWFAAHPHKHKLLIAGNHDLSLDPEHVGSNYGAITPILGWTFAEMGITYLMESTATINGVTFYGSPYTPTYGNWAFMERPFQLTKRYEKMPKVDVLITHGPPKMILDLSRKEHAGDASLLHRVRELQPKIHVFGHIHSGYGTAEFNGTKFFNAAQCNEWYVITNKPWEVEL